MILFLFCNLQIFFIKDAFRIWLDCMLSHWSVTALIYITYTWVAGKEVVGFEFCAAK